MPVIFRIPGPLRGFTNGCAEVRLNSAPGDLRGILEALWSEYPALRDRLVDEQGEVRQHVNVFVGNESVRYTGGLATLVADNSEIMIVPAVSGG